MDGGLFATKLLAASKNLAIGASTIVLYSLVLEPPMTKDVWVAHEIPPFSARLSYLNTSVAVFNTDWANNNPQPLPPNFVSCGALTAKPANALPPTFKAFVDSADSGVVYASLGSTVIPEAAEVLEMAKALTAIAPVKVIWKLAEQDLQVVGLNHSLLQVGSSVKLVNWAPQNDLLGHPNVKAFFTQAGMNSFNEAAYHGVPIVGMPLFGEQADNVARAVDKGWGLQVSVHPLPKLAQNLQQALSRVLQEPSFAKSAARMSYLMRAHRWTPAEVAASALEHAAWTQGEPHLQAWRPDLSWFQMQSLDVMLTAAALIGTISALLFCLTGLVAKAVWRFATKNRRRRMASPVKSKSSKAD